MASLGQLVVSLTAETAQFKEALSKAAYETDRAMKKIESSTSFVSTAFKTLLTAGVVAQVMGHKPSAIAEKHYRRRPIDLLRQWHTKIEKFILDEAGIQQPEFVEAKLRIVNGNI